MPSSAKLEVRPAQPADAGGLAALFASNGYGCHCRLWHFSGDHRAWLERCAQRPDENRAEMQAALAAGQPEMWGIVALRGGELVGWLKLAPVLALGKLYGQRLYKGLPCFDSDRSRTFGVACLLVREDVRHQGIARALLRGALEHAAARGAQALEALPCSDQGVADVTLMRGPTRLFLEAGFEVVHDFDPYPVLRRRLPVVQP